MQVSTYRCFLPDLTGFADLHCIGPGSFAIRRLNRKDRKEQKINILCALYGLLRLEPGNTIIMFFVRKFLPLIVLISLILFAEEDSLSRFLLAYYNGEYERAHELLKQAFSNPLTAGVWEERIHLQKKMDGCDFAAKDSLLGLALLRIGEMEQARSKFGEDWESLLGLATLSLWENDLPRSRDYISRSLKLSPGRPELLFFAGNVASTEGEVEEYFKKYLAQRPEDLLKKTSAEETIDFIQKTKGMDLNVSSLGSEAETIDSEFSMGRLLVKGKIDGKKSVTLLVDTGAAGLSLKNGDWQPKLTSNLLMIGLGKKQKTEGTRAVFDQFDAGKFEMKNAVVAISPAFKAADIDGVAGTVFFSDYLVLLPMRSGKEMTLFASSNEDPVAILQKHGLHFSSATTLPFRNINKMIILKGRVRKSEETLDILVDTGAHRSILAKPAALRHTHVNDPLSRMANQKPQLFGLGGQVEDLLVSDHVDVQIGPLKKNFDRMLALNLAEISEALELELDLILGQDFLEGYTLLIDYNHNTITFLR